MIKGSEDTRYTFPIGVIRVLETKLLTKSHYDRLLAVSGENEIMPALHDTTYGQFRDLAFEDVLEKVLEDRFQFLSRYCIDPEIIELILLPKRIHNLKVEFKGKIREEDYQDLLYEVEVGEIEGITDIIAQFLETKDPFFLDTGLDRLELTTSIRLSCRFPFLKNYYELKADLYNIASLIRLKRLGVGRKTALMVLIPSSFDPEHLALLLEQEFDAIKDFFARTPYHAVVAQGIDYLEKKNSFLRLERLIDEELLRYMRKTRRFVFGVEPIFGYYTFLESETTRLRRIYIGKRHRLPIEDIRESLPDVY